MQEQSVRTLASLQAPAGLEILLLRFHLITESFLDRLISGYLPQGERLLETGRLTYAQKLAVVESFSVVETAALEVLRELNSLRNRCAHVADYSLTEKDLTTIAKSFAREAADVAHRHEDADRAFVSWLMARVLGKLLKAVYLLEFFVWERRISGTKKPAAS